MRFLCMLLLAAYPLAADDAGRPALPLSLKRAV